MLLGSASCLSWRTQDAWSTCQLVLCGGDTHYQHSHCRKRACPSPRPGYRPGWEQQAEVVLLLRCAYWWWRGAIVCCQKPTKCQRPCSGTGLGCPNGSNGSKAQALYRGTLSLIHCRPWMSLPTSIHGGRHWLRRHCCPCQNCATCLSPPGDSSLLRFDKANN